MGNLFPRGSNLGRASGFPAIFLTRDLCAVTRIGGDAMSLLRLILAAIIGGIALTLQQAVIYFVEWTVVGIVSGLIYPSSVSTCND
jgi:hypothetical protein